MILNNNQIEAVKILQSVNSGIIVGGSVALKAYNLMDRAVGDLDVFIPKTGGGFNIEDFEKRADNSGSDFTTDFNGDTLERTPLNIKGVNVCIFKVPDYLLDFEEIEIDGLKIKIQNPCYAIAAKALFQKRKSKHTEDIKEIQRKLLNLTLY